MQLSLERITLEDDASISMSLVLKESSKQELQDGTRTQTINEMAHFMHGPLPMFTSYKKS